jgi:Flp pilus assembly protein TadG
MRQAVSNVTRRLRHFASVRRLLRRDDGAAAVEFAMVAAPFLALLFATMETALVFFAGQTLETAVADSSRLILTGQAQSQNFDQTAFTNAVCGKIYGLFTCSNLLVDVRTYQSFAAATTALPIDNQGNLQNNFVYQPGTACSIVVVRLMYQWPTYMSLLGFNLANLSNGNRLLMATAAFRNEPFSGGTVC